MLDKYKLIGFEYIPVELPNCFTTKDLAENYLDLLSQIKATSYKPSIPFFFTAYKNEYSRRRMALPNPYHYIKAVDVLCDNEAEFAKIFRASPYSLTKPKKDQRHTGNRAYNRVSNSTVETRKAKEKLFL